jgi:hypothetical protein
MFLENATGIMIKQIEQLDDYFRITGTCIVDKQFGRLLAPFDVVFDGFTIVKVIKPDSGIIPINLEEILYRNRLNIVVNSELDV